MKIKYIILILILACYSPIWAQKTVVIDTQLKTELQKLVDEFEGEVGVYVYHFDTKTELGINQDSFYPAASMIKIPIMIKIFDRIEKDEFDYAQTFPYYGKHDYEHESDFINRIKPGTQVPISKLLHLMMSLSDNTASLWLQYIAGTGTSINQWLKLNGYKNTYVNAKTVGREQIFKDFGWGTTTPREMTKMMIDIYNGKLITKDASEKMLRILSRSFWDGEALSQINPKNFIASKQGAVDYSKSEVVLVKGEQSTYAFCVITDNQKVKGYSFDDPGFVLIRKVSRVLYKHFEPNDKWTPTSQLDEYW